MKQLILAVILTAAAIGMFFGWTQGMLDKISAVQKEKQSLEDVLSRFYDLRKTKNELIEKYNSITIQDLEKLREIIPESTNEGDLIVEFENLTSDHGLLLKQIDIKHIDEKRGISLIVGEKPFKELPISLTVDGSYTSIKEFLASIEKSLRIIDIESLSFNAGDIDSYEFSISAKAYFQKP